MQKLTKFPVVESAKIDVIRAVNWKRVPFVLPFKPTIYIVKTLFAFGRIAQKQEGKKVLDKKLVAAFEVSLYRFVKLYRFKNCTY